MALLIDLFGYLSIVVHGLTIVAQSVTLGGVLFLVLLVYPLAPQLGPAGDRPQSPTVERLADGAQLRTLQVVEEGPRTTPAGAHALGILSGAGGAKTKTAGRRSEPAVR